MRKSLILLSFIAFLLFVFISSFAQQLTQSSPHARIQFSEKFWDFGYVPKDMKVSHIFQIKNSGTDTLVITRVRSDCGCIHNPLSDSRIAPSQASELEVIFNPQRFQGLITKAISVACNDTTAPVSDIAFTAQVGLENPMVKLNPEGIIFDTLTPSGELTKRVEVKNTSRIKVFISVVQMPKSFIDCQIEKLEILPDESTQIYFRTNPPLPAGVFRTSLTLDFKGSDKIRCTIPVHGVVIK
jgi:hypothetical protein